jgi:hypothetical protein
VATKTLFTTGETARLLGVQPWQVRRLFEAGHLPEPASRAGLYRLIPQGDLTKVRAALVEAGYLEGGHR